MNLMKRTLGLLTNSLLLGGLIGCGPGLSDAGLETQAQPITVDPSVRTHLPLYGGLGGGTFTDSCPAGYVATGLNVRSGDWLDQIQLICRKLNRDGTLGATAYTSLYGGMGGGPSTASCADSQIMTAEVIGAESWVYQVGAQCSTVMRVKNATGGFDSTIAPLGRTGGVSTQACPADSAITGIYGRNGSWVDQLGFICSKLDDVASTVTLQQGFTYQVWNVSINGSIQPSTAVAAGQNFLLDLDYSAIDTYCPGCIDQIIVGLVSSDPAVPPQPLACAYNGIPGSWGISGHSQLWLPAPQPGTYTLRIHSSQNYYCDLGWYGSPGPEAIIGEIEVL